MNQTFLKAYIGEKNLNLVKMILVGILIKIDYYNPKLEFFRL